MEFPLLLRIVVGRRYSAMPLDHRERIHMEKVANGSLAVITGASSGNRIGLGTALMRISHRALS
jgi:hypothetical protein